MENKDLIKEAIRNAEKFTPSQCKVFDLLLDLSIEYETTASFKFLLNSTGLNRNTIFAALKALQQDHIIIKNPNFPNTYNFDRLKLEQIIELHKVKKKK